jgi:hypothetical protein
MATRHPWTAILSDEKRLLIRFSFSLLVADDSQAAFAAVTIGEWAP